MTNLSNATTSIPRDLATVLVSHPSPLISAGLVSTLRRMPELDVRIWDQSEDPWERTTSLAGIDVVVADAELLARGASSTLAHLRMNTTAAPKVLLITTRAGRREIPVAMWSSVGACLSIQSGEEELFDAIRGLVGGDVADDLPMDTGVAAEAVDDAPCQRRARPRGGLPPGALRRVREYMEERLAEKIELSDLAKIAGLSGCHFSRAFKQSVGTPPHRYLVMRRIAAAAELIRTTNRSMTDIALEVGFSDQSHFTRSFSAVTGETPCALRRRHR